MKLLISLMLLIHFSLFGQDITFTKVEKEQKQIIIKEGDWIRYRLKEKPRKVYVKRYKGVQPDSSLLLSKDTVTIQEFVFCSKVKFLDVAVYTATYTESFFASIVIATIWAFNGFDGEETALSMKELMAFTAKYTAVYAVLLAPNYVYIHNMSRPKSQPDWKMEIGQ